MKIYSLNCCKLQTNPGLVRLLTTDLCLSVGGPGSERGAGAWARRDLSLRPCGEAEARAQIWNRIS